MWNFKAVLRESADLAKEIAVFMSVYYFATTYGVGGTQCVGPSMLPTFIAEGDFVLVDVFSHKVRNKEFQRGDVVISVCPYDPSKTVCKRVSAVSGDEVWVDAPGSVVARKFIVPRGHVWLLGDNRGNSLDSRKYGPVPAGLIKGTVFCKLRLQPPFVHGIESAEDIREVHRLQDEELRRAEAEERAGQGDGILTAEQVQEAAAMVEAAMAAARSWDAQLVEQDAGEGGKGKGTSSGSGKSSQREPGLKVVINADGSVEGVLGAAGSPPAPVEQQQQQQQSGSPSSVALGSAERPFNPLDGSLSEADVRAIQRMLLNLAAEQEAKIRAATSGEAADGQGAAKEEGFEGDTPVSGAVDDIAPELGDAALSVGDGAARRKQR